MHPRNLLLFAALLIAVAAMAGKQDSKQSSGGCVKTKAPPPDLAQPSVAKVSTSTLLSRIDELDKVAFDMAKTVVDNPVNRDRLAGGAKLLREQLQDNARILKESDMNQYQKVSDRISEALLDLRYSETETKVVSFRLKGILRKKEASAP